MDTRPLLVWWLDKPTWVRVLGYFCMGYVIGDGVGFLIGP